MPLRACADAMGLVRCYERVWTARAWTWQVRAHGRRGGWHGEIAVGAAGGVGLDQGERARPSQSDAPSVRGELADGAESSGPGLRACAIGM